MTPDPWFAPKAYGYGASPANWKGWAATAAFCAITAALGYSLIGRTVAHRQSEPWQWALFLALEAGLLTGFVWLTKVKCAGDWRWRWGDKS